MKFLKQCLLLSMMCAASYGMAKELRPAVVGASHHKGLIADVVTFRFNQEALCNCLPSAPTDEVEGTTTVQSNCFFFPQLTVKGKAVQQFIQQMNVTEHPAYRISFQAVDLPMEGYMCMVSYDSSKVSFQVESGISPKGEPSILLTFYDNSKLTAIKHGHNSILNVAHYDRVPDPVKKKYA